MIEKTSGSKPVSPRSSEEIKRTAARRVGPTGASTASRIAPIKKSPPADQQMPKNPRLKKLRDEVKSAMIPLMVEVLERKLEGQQAGAPSRLQRGALRSQEEICEDLEGLLKELKIMGHWGQSCEKQALKALAEMRGTLSPQAASHSKVKQSFAQAVRSQPPLPTPAPQKRKSLVSFVLQWVRGLRNNPQS